MKNLSMFTTSPEHKKSIENIPLNKMFIPCPNFSVMNIKTITAKKYFDSYKRYYAGLCRKYQ